MERIEILKTYKLYIGGKFPRTESGRYYQPQAPDGSSLGNLCRSSGKDFRDAVVAARAAQPGWAARSAFNRSQILYRIGEMLEGRKAQFEGELIRQGCSPDAAAREVVDVIDRCVYYAGWCDKYRQVFSAVNPVSSSHFCFSLHEPVGVVAAIAPERPSFSGLAGILLPIIAGGNACVVLASETAPLAAISFAEVLATSDLPGGVVNLLTGFRGELCAPMAAHMDVDALVAADLSEADQAMVRRESAANLKRVIFRREDISAEESPYPILATQEVKTTWHPVESGIGGGSFY